MKIIFLILFILFLALANTVSSQWIHQQSGTTAALYNVKFINNNTGFISGQGRILKTTNAGEDWINKPIPFSYALRDISIADSNVIYVGGQRGRILKSTNEGDDWVNLYSDTLAGVRACHFINESTGWVAGTRSFPNYSFLVKTTDGGSTFISQAFANLAISDIYFKDANTGLLVAAGSIWRSTNGGFNWYQANYNFNGSGYEFNRFGIVDDQYCWLVSYTRPVYRSTDFGENWDSIALIPSGKFNNNIESTFFIDQNTGWVGAVFGKAFKTIDGGLTWTECSTPQPSGFISDIFFLNENTGWAVEGNNGNIFKTTNGGCNTVGITLTSSGIPEVHNLYQNYPNPFNPSTNIQFDLPKEGFVSIKIYDMLGREIATLVNEHRNAGSYILGFNGSNLSSGIYYCKIKAGNFEATKRMVLVK